MASEHRTSSSVGQASCLPPVSLPSPRQAGSLSCLILAAVLLWPAAQAGAASVQASQGQITLPTYPWAAVKHPYFRGTDKVNIYPYPMLDFLSREKTNHTYKTVVLENEYLRITFLPELGGKIHEVTDKTTRQPMFYVNHVIKPGLIGQCGAWTSGGVEWNTGPQGHTVGCMQEVPVVILPAEKDGSRSVAIGETERIYGTKWTVIVSLRPGRSFIEERIRIYNPTETVRPYYFWNCTAAPNTPGFRFIYPMTLGTDHGSEKFFNWPIDHGKDLSRGTNYQDASSIFAWHCDQDFFGSYNDDLDHGVVSFANHHQVPGKKAWTWGQGGFGKMHQMDLTDTDGPYNEVQTGPLLTQGEVGRLDPCEAVSWQEWWYPVHGIGGFTFANKELAANAAVEAGQLRLRLLGSGTWSPVEVRVIKGTTVIARARAKLSPKLAEDLNLDLAGGQQPLDLEITAGGKALARFRVPLDLPKRTPPERRTASQTATDLAETGWREFMFARFAEAEAQFGKALEKDSRCVAAHTGLALLDQDRNPAASARSARAALEANPDAGLARFALAVAEMRLGKETEALDEAWLASRDPAVAVPARALVAKLLLRRGEWQRVVEALTEAGPWQADSVCRNRLALALARLGREVAAMEVIQGSLRDDPLDAFAASVPRLSQRAGRTQALPVLGQAAPQQALELVAEYVALGQRETALDWAQAKSEMGDLLLGLRGKRLLDYWRILLASERQGTAPSSVTFLKRYEAVFPDRFEELELLRWAVQSPSKDGQATLYLGHLLFHLGRHAEGREMWKKAAELGAEPVIAYRALGMAAKTLEGDLKTAREWLQKASQADPTDAIVARDLAHVLFALADKATDAEKRTLTSEACARLKAAFASGKGRSDFVALLARAQNRLGEFAETARMLDTVRVTVWEGAHEVHDLFEEAHLALGKTQLEANRAAQALAEFNRALEYPENLATGKLEHAREAHIHYLRGNAFAALGQKQEAIAAWKKAADEPASRDSRANEARKKAREALDKAGN